MAVLSADISAMSTIPPPTIEIYVSASGSKCSGSCSSEAISPGIAYSSILSAMPIIALTFTAIIAIVRASSVLREPSFCAMRIPAPLATVMNKVVSA
ncbi:hypothetical protein D3C80_1745010 [compost metagenome]